MYKYAHRWGHIMLSKGINNHNGNEFRRSITISNQRLGTAHSNIQQIQQQSNNKSNYITKICTSMLIDGDTYCHLKG